MPLLKDLHSYVSSQREAHDVPGLSVAVWRDGELSSSASGVLSVATGVEATTDSLFSIASVTKVMTASVMMALVDAGEVDLDRPVTDYLRDFLLLDGEALTKITVRHLLNHTSGIAGDFFYDDRRHQGNLIARYVDRCAALPVIHPVGEMHSYSNSAFVIAGRVIEIVTGMGWREAVEEMVFKPLGMAHAIADPRYAVPFRAAIGHVREDGAWAPRAANFTMLGNAPAGAVLASASDLIRFARAHMEGGKNRDGAPWLSGESVSAMQRPGLEKPRLSQIARSYAGIGWGITDYVESDVRVFSHGGATQGSLSMVQMIPERNAAFAILTNGYNNAVIQTITRDCLSALAGVDKSESEFVEPVRSPARDEPMAGIYESFDSLIDVSCDDEGLLAHIIMKHDPAPPARYRLKHIEGLCYAVFGESGARRAQNLAFLAPDEGGRPLRMTNGGRISTRVR